GRGHAPAQRGPGLRPEAADGRPHPLPAGEPAGAGAGADPVCRHAGYFQLMPINHEEEFTMTRLEEVQYLRTEPDGRHYNCAQSLLVPFASEVGLTKEQADALGANFGAGMKMGSTCG